MQARYYQLSFDAELPALVVGSYEPKGYRALKYPLTRDMACPGAAHLSNLLNALNYRSQWMDPDRLQLMRLETGVRMEGLNSIAPIGGHVSEELGTWVIKAHKDGERYYITRILKTMWRARNALSSYPQPVVEGPNPFGPVEVLFNLNGTFNLANGGASVWSTPERQLECHNVDTPFSQLPLLAGLATLHEMADKDLYPPPA